MRKSLYGGVAVLCLITGACTPTEQAAIASFEAKAAPVVANACAKFRAAEANPLVQIAVAGGTVALDAATGLAAGPAIAAIRSYGDQFCANGPPSGDGTTPDQQAAWLNQQITGQLIALVGSR